MTAVGMLLAGFGVVLIMAGVKGEDVRDVIAAPFRRANDMDKATAAFQSADQSMRDRGFDPDTRRNDPNAPGNR